MRGSIAGRVRGRLPRAALACALVALANGIAWSLIVPPFQVPDENAHYAYVAQVAERGTVPRPVAAGAEGPLSPAEDAMLADLLTYGITGKRGNPAPYSYLQQRVIEAAANQHLSPRGSGNALTATSNPPLYYALEAIPYKLTPGGKVLDRLELMRLLSALMGAVTVLLIYLFLRELLPGRPWAWSAGALVAAFQPLFGFMSGGVNNDDLLYLMAAGVLWSLARAFRQGLSPATGAALGAFLGLGLVSKLTLVGFLPAAALAVILLLRRAWSGERSDVLRPIALRGAAWAAALCGVPVAVYVFLNHVVWKRTAVPGGVGGVSGTGGHSSLHEEFAHVWQLFLPRLWMHPRFSYFPLWETWFKGIFGRFGWLDYDFPSWVYKFALLITLVVVALALAELVRCRAALVRRLGELLVYALAFAGLCAEIGVQSYRYLVLNGGQFEQPRYLLSALGLYAAIAALAVRFGGRRWGPVLAALLVVLAIGHDLFSQAITIARYYA